jgi:hypothetical protein
MWNDNITPAEQHYGWNSNNRKAHILNNKRFENGEKISIDFDKRGSRHKYPIMCGTNEYWIIYFLIT